MHPAFILVGIILGIAWRIAMPFFRKVKDGKLPFDDFDLKYVYEGVATLLYATPIGVLFYFRFVPPEASGFVIFLAAFAWGYTAQNLTNGGPAWITDILVYTGLMKKPPDVPDNPGHDNPGNPGHDNPGNPGQSAWEKLFDWLTGRNGTDPTKKAEARLELIVFAPLQFFLFRAIWDLTEAASAQNWAVANTLLSYIWKMAVVAVALLWGRNGRSWINAHMTDWLTDRQARKTRAAEFRAKLSSTEGIIQSVQDAMKLVSHTQELLKGLPVIPKPPEVPDAPSSDSVPPAPPTE